MTIDTAPAPFTKKALAAAGVLGLATLALVGCSSSDDSAASEETAASSAPAADEQQARGVSGEIALVQDGLLQVQSDSEQTAVTYTDDTAITQEVAAALSDVTAGVCITGMGDDDGVLTSVAITAAVDGSCTAGFGGIGGSGGPGGSGGSGAPSGSGDASAAPEDMEPPTDGEMPEGEMPDGEMPAGGAFGNLVSGLVTAVNGTSITVDAVSFSAPSGDAGSDAGSDSDSGSGDSDATAAPEVETTSQEVTVDDTTTFTRTETVGSDALAVGLCVVALGDYDGEEYAATSLALSDAGDEGCTSGFGGMGGNMGGGSRGGDSDATSGSDAGNE